MCDCVCLTDSFIVQIAQALLEVDHGSIIAIDDQRTMEALAQFCENRSGVCASLLKKHVEYAGMCQRFASLSSTQ